MTDAVALMLMNCVYVVWMEVMRLHCIVSSVICCGFDPLEILCVTCINVNQHLF